jgi:hypothetical protein
MQKNSKKQVKHYSKILSLREGDLLFVLGQHIKNLANQIEHSYICIVVNVVTDGMTVDINDCR